MVCCICSSAFFFFCPASVYQQSFLGGEQTTASTPTNPSEQHWNQQCKPIKLATFEFDFKYQAQSANSRDEIDGAPDSWNEVLPSIEFGNDDLHRSRDKDRGNLGHGAINFNGNATDEEPVSLSADCLQDIHNLSQSMHNLINDLRENQVHQYRFKTSHSATSSLNSIPENVNLSKVNNSTLLNNYQNIGTGQINRSYDGSSVQRNISSLNKGNSDTEIYSTTPVKSDISTNSNVHSFETPKSVLSTKKQRVRRRKEFYENLCEDLIVPENVISKFESDDMKNCNTLLSSVDSLSNDASSSNEIETSDSFVNIQFVQLSQDQRSSSTQSMESTDSFENICFSYNQESKNDNVCDPNENDCINALLQLNLTKNSSLANQEKSVTKILQTPTTLKVNASRLPRLHNLSNTKKSRVKTPEETKCAKNEVVKLRRDRYTPKNDTDSRTSARSRRFSSFLPSSAKKVPESILVSDKLISVTAKVGRKFSSTDELRDDKQKQSSKSKRFSLYYTPQPLRKNYEGESKAGRSRCTSVSNRSDRHSNGKASDLSKKKDDVLELCEKKPVKCRRSVIDSTTAATRSRSSKQSVHNKSNIVNSTVMTSRIK